MNLNKLSAISSFGLFLFSVNISHAAPLTISPNKSTVPADTRTCAKTTTILAMPEPKPDAELTLTITNRENGQRLVKVFPVGGWSYKSDPFKGCLGDIIDIQVKVNSTPALNGSVQIEIERWHISATGDAYDIPVTIKLE